MNGQAKLDGCTQALFVRRLQHGQVLPACLPCLHDHWGTSFHTHAILEHTPGTARRRAPGPHCSSSVAAHLCCSRCPQRWRTRGTPRAAVCLSGGGSHVASRPPGTGQISSERCQWLTQRAGCHWQPTRSQRGLQGGQSTPYVTAQQAMHRQASRQVQGQRGGCRRGTRKFSALHYPVSLSTSGWARERCMRGR